jgi:hypothetical protein
VAARPRADAVARELDEVEGVVDRQRPREIGEEDDARLERGDEERLAPGVVGADLAAQLADARRDLLGTEVDVADAAVQVYDASSSP